MQQLPIEFFVRGVPISSQASSKKKRQWRNTVASAAKAGLGQWQPLEQRLHVHLTHYYVGGYIDLDNLAKPFLDAIKGIVYKDDELIDSLHLVRRDRNVQSFPDVTDNLASILESESDFVHVYVNELYNVSQAVSDGD